MKKEELISVMDTIARKIITSVFITDFTEHDVKSINRYENGIPPFFWMLRQTGTWLFFAKEIEELKFMLEAMKTYRHNRTEILLYHYDGTSLAPIFMDRAKEWAEKEIKSHETSLQT